jgi:hypothetical protein
MRARTSIAVLATGAVLTFAVSGHSSFLDIRLAGVVLMLTGVAGLWPLGGKVLLLLGRSRLRRFLDETAPVQGPRVPLDDLLRQPAGISGQHPGSSPDVWAPCAGHQEMAPAGHRRPAHRR